MKHRLTEKQYLQRAAAGRGTAHALINGVKVPVRMSQYDVSLKLGVSQMMVSIIERKAIQKLLKGLL